MPVVTESRINSSGTSFNGDQAPTLPNKHSKLLGLGSSGDNFRRFFPDVKKVSDVYTVGRRRVGRVGDTDIPHDRQFALTDTEDIQRMKGLLAEGAFTTVYDSTPPQLRLGNLVALAPYLESGALSRVVITKPVAQTHEDHEAMQQLAEMYGDRIYVHEHYIAKGAYQALRKNLNVASQTLGRLTDVAFSIQEARTIENEKRVDTLAGGAFEDLSSHPASLMLDIEKVINGNGRYRVSEKAKPETTLTTLRYAGTQIPDGRDTGFVVQGKKQIIDNVRGETNDLTFTWTGGKGIGTEDKKQMALTFVHPATSKRSRILVDLQNNIIQAPASVAHLFPADQIPQDNGYGSIAASGLNGGDPNRGLQTLNDALRTWEFNDSIKRGHKKQTPLGYDLRRKQDIATLMDAITTPPDQSPDHLSTQVANIVGSLVYDKLNKFKVLPASNNSGLWAGSIAEEDGTRWDAFVEHDIDATFASLKLSDPKDGKANITAIAPTIYGRTEPRVMYSNGSSDVLSGVQAQRSVAEVMLRFASLNGSVIEVLNSHSRKGIVFQRKAANS